MARKFNPAVAAALALAAALSASQAAQALSMGRMRVLSGLGEPLHAEIDLVSVQKGQASGLQARLAPLEAYRAAGLSPNPAQGMLQFEVKPGVDGAPAIVITSTQPMRDPFVDMLVELDWSTGRQIRQFVFLLDSLGPQAGAASQTAQAPRLSQTALDPPRAPALQFTPAPSALAGRLAASDAANAVAQPPAAAVPQGGEAMAPVTTRRPEALPAAAPRQEPVAQVEVKPGDTLARIAEKTRPEGVSLEQMLVALYQANQDAFINRNLNLVRVGRVLTVPSPDTVRAVSEADAHQLLIAQGSQWRAYRQALVEAASRSAAPEAPAGASSAGKVSAQVQEPGNAPGRDRVRLAGSADQAAGTAPSNGGAAAPSPAADDAIAGEREMREMRERVAALEKNVSDLSAALRLKNEQLAALQRQSEQMKAAAGAAAGSAAMAPSPAAPAAPAAPVASAPPAAPEAAPASPAAPAAGSAESSPPAAGSEAAAPAPAPAEVPPEAGRTPLRQGARSMPAAEPGLLDSFTDSLPLMGGLVVLAAVLVGGLVWFRRGQTEQIEDSLMSAAGADAHSVFGPDQGQPTRTVQHDYSQAGIGAIDTDEVDPVAEADVYMAYGRDAQAEEILKEALQKDVTRHAARVKLLEIYAARKDLKAFETTAGELFAATQGHGPQWEQAAALGAKLDPDNPLYAAVAEPAGALPPDYQGLKLHAEQYMAGQALDPIPLEAERISADAGLGYATAGLGLDLGEGILQGEPTVDLELTELRLDAEHPAPGRGAAAPGQDRAPLDFGSISLDLGPGPGSTSGAVPGAEPAAEAGVAGPTDARWQEAATKLDLAKAYHEMGDRDGARELLAEVVKEGDVVQREQARKLLEAID